MFIWGILGLFVIGLAMLPVCMYGVVHIGVYTLLLLGIILCIVGFFSGKLRSFCTRKYKWIRNMTVGMGSLFAVFVLVITSCMLYAAYGNGPSVNIESTVLVLGCQVKGSEDHYYPSLMLRRRLETAAGYLRENPQAICVVSGGKGNNEPVPESRCMRDYLIENGIDPARIIEENQSKNTAENIAYSKKIIEEKKLPQELVIVTDGFHQFRAQMLANKEQMSAKGISAQTPFGLNTSYYVREWYACIRLLVLGQ